MTRSALMTTGSVLAALLFASSAMAQPNSSGPSAQPDTAASESEDGEIVITAQRRAERSRDVPISVTNLTEQQLTVANVNQLSDTMKLTPGLRFDAAGAFFQPTIRGISTPVTNAGGGPNVGIYVDGFFQSNPQVADFQLMKVKSIQVLKGPQGTLFGRNTTGGAILVTTADPSTEPAADFKASYGRFNTVTLQGYATHGLGDNVALDVEGLYRRGDGYTTNIIGGDDEVGQFENWSIRTGLKVDISDNVSVLLRYMHSESDDPTAYLTNAFVDQSGEAGFFAKVSPAGQAFYGTSSSAGLPLIYFYTPPGLFATDPDEIATLDRLRFLNKSDAVQGTIKADLGFADLTSYTQWRHDRSQNFEDLDATALQFFYILLDIDNETFSQEILLNSKPGSRLQWVGGLNYYQNRDTWRSSASFFGIPLFPFGGASTTAKSYAAFLDMTYEVTDNLFFTAGARYSHDVVTDAYYLTNPPIVLIPVNSLKGDQVTPRFVLRYKPDDNSSIYASFTRGYKAGILDVGAMSDTRIKPENINAFEAGYKYDNGKFSVDLAAFYYDYKNLQVSSYQNGAAKVTNAASSEIYGAEAQFRYRVNDAFNIYGGAAWTHARYKSFPNAPYYSYCDPTAVALPPPANNDMVCGVFGPGSLTQTTTDASGLRMMRSPDFTANFGASYGLDVGGGRLTLSGNLYYSSSLFFDPAQQFRQKAFEVLSLRAEWLDPSERFSVALFGDNVTDSRYQTQVLFTTLGIGGTWSAPTTYGVELRARF